MALWAFQGSPKYYQPQKRLGTLKPSSNPPVKCDKLQSYSNAMAPGLRTSGK